MKSQYNNIHFKDEESVDVREFLSKCLLHWKWLLISVSFIGIITAYFLRRTIPEYSVSATILIKDAKKGVGGNMSELSAFHDLGVFNNSNNSLDNEIEILKSRTLLAKVIKDLNLNIKYKKEGPIRTREFYKNSPVQIHFVEGDSLLEITEAHFKLTVISKNQYNIELEDESLGLFHFDDKISTPHGELIISLISRNCLPIR